MAPRRIKHIFADAAFTGAATAAILVGKGADLRIAASGGACWVAQGDNTVAATDGTASEQLVVDGEAFEFNTGENEYVSLIAASAGTADVSIGRWMNPGEDE